MSVVKTAQPRNRATAQPRNSAGNPISTADTFYCIGTASFHTPVFSNRTVGFFLPTSESSIHAVDSFTGMADAASRTVGSASQTADLVIGTAGSSNRMAEASNRMGG